jgi:hypothetical protein
MLPNQKRCRPILFAHVVVCSMLVAAAQLALGQAGSVSAAPRIAGAIDETHLVPLAGNTHPAAVPRYDQGAVSDSFPMEHMYLSLRRNSAQEAALGRLLVDQQDPNSAQYHHWLTPDRLGNNYGPAQQDIDAVLGWLSSHGLTVNRVSKSGVTIDISGTAGEIRSAFHTEIHRYEVNGEQHIANASDPQIPAALASVVAGLNSLNDFMPKPASESQGRISPFSVPVARMGTTTSRNTPRRPLILPRFTTSTRFTRAPTRSPEKGRPSRFLRTPI